MLDIPKALYWVIISSYNIYYVKLKIYPQVYPKSYLPKVSSLLSQHPVVQCRFYIN